MAVNVRGVGCAVSARANGIVDAKHEHEIAKKVEVGVASASGNGNGNEEIEARKAKQRLGSVKVWGTLLETVSDMEVSVQG